MDEWRRDKREGHVGEWARGKEGDLGIRTPGEKMVKNSNYE